MVDYTSRLFRVGKARLSGDVAGILDRLGTSAEFWESQVKNMFAKARLLGNHFSGSRQRLRDVARRKGLHHLDNAVPLPASA